jgi:hypothetical protein
MRNVNMRGRPGLPLMFFPLAPANASAGQFETVTVRLSEAPFPAPS